MHLLSAHQGADTSEQATLSQQNTFTGRLALSWRYWPWDPLVAQRDEPLEFARRGVARDPVDGPKVDLGVREPVGE